MNKLYQRINWQNYPSDSTPLNESNLNKMDAAVDGIDDRVVTLDVTKLPVATANTMVKDVTFNETTGVFTITKLNGTKVTVNTALEKIATNFRFDHSTQKLILTLIDGTTQEVDLSALLTQYEFLNSSTIQFTIDSSGKVKASVVNGSITGDMLEPNYLANVTLQASKADTSAKNAKESEEKAAEYAESSKNSADSAEPVASTATGKNPTIQDSTNAPLIYGKFKGYTEQQTYSGKNKSSAGNLTGTLDAFIPINHLVDGTTYTLSCVLSSTDTDSSSCIIYKRGSSGEKFLTNGIRNTRMSLNFTKESGDTNIRIFASASYDFSIGDTITISDIQIEEGTTATPYEPYVGGIASPNPDYPQEIKALNKVSVKTCGKNIFGGLTFAQALNSASYSSVLDENAKTITFDRRKGTENEILFDKFKENTQYTLIVNGKVTGTAQTTNTCLFMVYGDGKLEIVYFGTTEKDIIVTTKENATVKSLMLGYRTAVEVTLNYEKCGVFEGVVTVDDFEAYTETTATIPTDAPLYEGDYLEVYADGSGKLVRAMAEVVFDGSADEAWLIQRNKDSENTICFRANSNVGAKSGAVICNKLVNTPVANADIEGINNSLGSLNYEFIISINKARLSTLDSAGLNTWLQSNPVTVIYELAEPTETPLTAEQVAEFKKLYTFEPVTNVLCEGETEIQYYKNTPSGVAVGTVHRMADNNKATYDGDGNVITETYAKKSSVLSTVAECEASTSNTDIAGANALVEFGTGLNSKVNIIEKEIDYLSELTLNHQKDENLRSKTVNLFNSNELIANKIVLETGEMVDYTAENWAVTQYLECKMGDVIYCRLGNGQNLPCIVLYDENKNFIRAVYVEGTDLSTLTYTVKDVLAKYFVYNVYPKERLGYGAQFACVTSFESMEQSSIVEIRQLYDVNSVDTSIGCQWISNNLSIAEISYQITGSNSVAIRAFVQEGKTYIANAVYANSYLFNIKENNLIKLEDVVDEAYTIDGVSTYSIFTIPEGYNILFLTLARLQKLSNDLPCDTVFEPILIEYNDILIFDKYKYDYDEVVYKYDTKKPLTGVKCVSIGDSITWYDDNEYLAATTVSGCRCKGYQSYIQELLGIEKVNMGYSGENSNYMLNKVRNTDFSNIPIVTIMTGMNDGGQNVSVTTYKSNITSMITHILGQNPKCKIFLLSPTFGYYTGSVGAYTTGYTVDDYADAMKEVGVELNIPYYDNYHNNGINRYNVTKYMADSVPTVNYYIHPNYIAYKIIGTQVANWMKSLLLL